MSNLDAAAAQITWGDYVPVLEEIQVRIGTPSTRKASEVWGTMRPWFDAQNISFEMWSKMTPEEQTITKKLVRDSLTVLIDNVDEWVPYALDSTSGDYVAVNVLMQYTQIQKEIWLAKMKYEKELSEAKASVTKMISAPDANDA